ncbi:MAG TPA: hypothetical protein VGF89_11265 [Steroidobacteraceae bacterium]|jgi:hypothetical protein
MFEFLCVLISIILGLALTHLLRGLAQGIHLRHIAKPYRLQLVWADNTLLSHTMAPW